MYSEVNKNNYKVEIFAEEDDKCFNCQMASQCPLFHAVSKELVVLRYANIEVSKCDMYIADIDKMKETVH